MTIEVLDAQGDVITIPTLADLVDALGVTRFYHKVDGTPLVRPADTVAYEVHDSVSNSATPGSVTPNVMSLADLVDQPFTVETILLSTDDTGVAAVEAFFEMLLFSADPSAGVVAGNAAAYRQTRANYIGRYSGSFTGAVGYFSDGAVARLVPASGENRLIINPGTGTTNIWWQLKTLTAFQPSGSSTTFTPSFEGFFGRV